jgi:hypothetical protein
MLTAEDLKNNCKISTKRNKKSGKTSERMEQFGFLISIAGLNMHNTGNDDDGVDYG